MKLVLAKTWRFLFRQPNRGQHQSWSRHLLECRRLWERCQRKSRKRQ